MELNRKIAEEAIQKIGRLTAAHRSRLAPVELTPAGIFDSEDLVEWCWFIFLALPLLPWVMRSVPVVAGTGRRR